MVESSSLILPDPAATGREGALLANALQATRPAQMVVYLEGDLGAGKTTLARGFLKALGHTGRVPSPTYTLIEPYTFAGYDIYHVDLYRVGSGREFEHLGLADQLGAGSVALIEWPDHGADRVPPADLRAQLRHVPSGRTLTWTACTETGGRVLAQLKAVR